MRIYDVSSSGTALFTETHNPVTVSNGIFNILLGSVDTNVNPLNLSFSTQYYLGITVGADPEMLPRQPLAASPYALRAVTAESLAPGGRFWQLPDPAHSAEDLTGRMKDGLTGALCPQSGRLRTTKSSGNVTMDTG